MGKGSGSESTTTVRYPPYLESAHQDHITQVSAYVDALKDLSPYSTYTDIDTVEDAFFSAGYSIDSFPSLWDMYGKFIAGLDIEVLWDQAYEDIIDGPVTEGLVSAESDLLDDQVISELTRFKVGMRDINSVIASTFPIGKALIEDGRTKAVAKFSAELKYRLLPLIDQRWRSHLDWNKGVVMGFADLIKFYYSAKMDVDNQNLGIAVKNTLWPFTVMNYQGVAVGTLTGAYTSTTKTDDGSSKFGGFLSGALSGASAGMSTGNPYVAAAGAVIGGIAGLFR